MINSASDQKEKTELAKALLRRVLSDPLVVKGLPVKTVLAIGKDERLTKRVMKDARKEIGVISENRNGVYFWILPQEQEES